MYKCLLGCTKKSWSTLKCYISHSKKKLEMITKCTYSVIKLHANTFIHLYIKDVFDVLNFVIYKRHGAFNGGKQLFVKVL